MDDGKLFSTLEYLLSAFAGMVARAVVEPSRDIESLRGRLSAFEPRESTRQALRCDLRECRSVGGVESLLNEAFHL